MVDWGSVPTWVATIGALVAVAFTGRSYVLNRRRETREQASKVACWAYPAGNGEWHLAVLNRSDLPVFDLTGTLSDPKTAAPLLTLRHAAVPPSADVKAIPVGDAFRWGNVGVTTAVLGLTYDDTAQPVQIEFRDAAGLTWQRDGTGRLHRGGRRS